MRTNNERSALEAAVEALAHYVKLESLVVAKNDLHQRLLDMDKQVADIRKNIDELSEDDGGHAATWDVEVASASKLAEEVLQAAAPAPTLAHEKPEQVPQPNLPTTTPEHLKVRRRFYRKPTYQGARPCFSVDPDTGRDIALYKTLTEAAAAHGIGVTRVSYLCHGRPWNPKMGPVTFRYATPTKAKQ